MNKMIIGTCGNCNGPVTLPLIWHGIKPPVAHCENCGATPKEHYGPVIQMEKPVRTIENRITEYRKDPLFCDKDRMKEI